MMMMILGRVWPRGKKVGRSFNSGSGVSQLSTASQVPLPSGPVPPVASFRPVDV